MQVTIDLRTEKLCMHAKHEQALTTWLLKHVAWLKTRHNQLSENA